MGRWLALVLLVLAVACPASADIEVIYPSPESADDHRFHDLIELLDTALQRTQTTHGDYQLKPSAAVMQESRYLLELGRQRTLNVAWTSTSEAKERELLPIRIPLRKGLLGYRISLIHQAGQKDIAQIKTLSDLRRLTLGQGLGWGDVAIYRSNDIPVHEANYSNLFAMLNARRIDLFPRGINEIFEEYQANHSKYEHLAIEQHVLIVYPWPYYFFTHRQDVELASRIETGLRRMQRDGSFDAIFMKHHRAAIDQANLGQRHIIRVRNPLLPAATPLDDKELWYDPFLRY